MNVEISFTYLNMGLSLCLVCNLGAIRGRFRRVFGSVLFAVLFLHLKRRKARLLAWTRPDRQKQTVCCWRVTGGLNWPMRVPTACSLQRPCPRQKPSAREDRPIAECFSNLLRPELLFDHREGWMGCRNYVALWIWSFYGDSLRCAVIREWFVGLSRLQSPTFLLNSFFHVHNFILAFWEPKWISHTKSYSEGRISQLDRILILSLGRLWRHKETATVLEQQNWCASATSVHEPKNWRRVKNKRNRNQKSSANNALCIYLNVAYAICTMSVIPTDTCINVLPKTVLRQLASTCTIPTGCQNRI